MKGGAHMCSQVRQCSSSSKNFARRPPKCDLRKLKQAESKASPEWDLVNMYMGLRNSQSCGDENVKTGLPVVMMSCTTSISMQEGNAALTPRPWECWSLRTAEDSETCSVLFHSSHFYEMLPTLFI